MEFSQHQQARSAARNQPDQPVNNLRPFGDQAQRAQSNGLSTPVRDVRVWRILSARKEERWGRERKWGSGEEQKWEEQRMRMGIGFYGWKLEKVLSWLWCTF